MIHPSRIPCLICTFSLLEWIVLFETCYESSLHLSRVFLECCLIVRLEFLCRYVLCRKSQVSYPLISIPIFQLQSLLVSIVYSHSLFFLFQESFGVMTSEIEEYLWLMKYQLSLSDHEFTCFSILRRDLLLILFVFRFSCFSHDPFWFGVCSGILNFSFCDWLQMFSVEFLADDEYIHDVL